MERSLAHIALFAALIFVLGLVPKLDMGIGVPITAQSLGIMLAGTVLGAKRGALAVLLFLGVGLLGVPVFAGLANTWAKLGSPSVGFVIGFPVAAFVTGFVMERMRGDVVFAAFNAAVIGSILVLYLFGIPGLAIMSGKPMAEAAMGSLIFLPGDLIKAALAALVTQAVARARPGSLLSRA